MTSRTKKIAIACAIVLVYAGFYLFPVAHNPVAPENPDDGLLHVYFLDVGQGDAIYVRSPGGKDMLMDAGPRGPILEKLREVMPASDTAIDYVFESHPDADHIGGIPDVLRQFAVGQFFEPGIESKNKIDDEIRDLLKEKGMESTLARRGMEIDLGSTTVFKVLFPDKDVSRLKDTNDASIVGQVMYGSTTIMLTGDSPQKIETYLIRLASLDGASASTTLKSDILKLGHHGSRTSSGKAYVAAVAPAWAIISAGKDNRYGHPHKQTLDTLRALKIPYLETSKEGTIEFVSDGRTVWRK